MSNEHSVSIYSASAKRLMGIHSSYYKRCYKHLVWGRQRLVIANYRK